MKLSSLAYAIVFAFAASSLGSYCCTPPPATSGIAGVESSFRASPAGPGAYIPLQLYVTSASAGPEVLFWISCSSAAPDGFSLSLQDAEGRPLERGEHRTWGNEGCLAVDRVPRGAAGSGNASGAAGAGSGSAAGAAGAGSGSAGGAGGGAPQLLYCSGELGRWQLTDEQKGAYCRNGGPDGDRCELTLQAVIAPPPGARPDGLLGPLACEWGASVSNYDFYQLDDPTVDIVP